MNAEDEVPPLPSHLLGRLDLAAPLNPELEERTVQQAKGAGLLGGVPVRSHWRWLPRAVAASLLFATGVAVGRWGVGTGGTTVTAVTPSERLEGAALRYLAALDAAPVGDSLSDLVAVASFRAAAQQVMARFPEQNVKLALSVSFAEGSLHPPGIPGRKEHTLWY